MTSLNAKLAISALGMMMTLASPAFAQKVHRYSSPQHATTSDPIDPNGRGIYNRVPTPRGIYNMAPTQDDPTLRGGGIFYNPLEKNFSQ